jgi:hypothetical protein
VSAGRIDGGPVPRPRSWTEAEDGTAHCLSCSRAMAAETAIETAPAGSSAEQRSKLRRTALIEFEIERDPAAPDRTIAQACRTSTAAVAAVRRKSE